jgi:hypothetical protein
VSAVCSHHTEDIMYNDLLLNRIGAAPVEDPDEHIQDLIDEIEELKSLTSLEAQELIRDLRPRLVTDDVYEEIEEHASFGDRMADKLATLAGSWRFIIFFARWGYGLRSMVRWARL